MGSIPKLAQIKNMLEKLVLKHSLWLNMAKGICKDAYLADDLVSEMYLKLSDCNKELIEDGYVLRTLRNLFIDWLREEKKGNLKDAFNTLDQTHWNRKDRNEPSAPYDKTYVGYCESNSQEYYEQELTLPNCLSWVEKQILLLRQEKSCREIERIYKIPYLKVYRTELKAKEKIQGWAEEKYKELATS